MENPERIKLDIRPLEIDNLFTIRHINAFVNSYFVSNPNDSKKGTITIEIDVDGGVEKFSKDDIQASSKNKDTPKVKPASKAKGKVKPDDVVIPDGGVKLSLVYNENVIKLSPNPNSALELTLKFSINKDSFFLLNNKKEIISVNQNNQFIDENNNILSKSPTDTSGRFLSKSPTDTSGGVLSKSPTDTSGDFLSKSLTDTTSVAFG